MTEDIGFAIPVDAYTGKCIANVPAKLCLHVWIEGFTIGPTVIYSSRVFFAQQPSFFPRFSVGLSVGSRRN